MFTVQIFVREALEEQARHRHCNSVQQTGSYAHMASVPGRRKDSMALSDCWLKKLSAAPASIAAETPVIDQRAAGLMAERAWTMPGEMTREKAALQMLSSNHILVVRTR